MATREAKIRFSAETSEFNSEIKKAESEITSLRKMLALNATQLKGNAGDTSLLKERQALLTQEMGKSQEKVALINQKLEKAKEIYGEDSQEVKRLTNQLIEAKTQESAIQNEISKTTAELKEQSSAVLDTSGKLDSFGKTVENAGKKASVVSAGIGVIGAASIKAAMEVDEGADIIITKTGASGEALGELEKSMNNVYTSLPTDANNAGIAIGEVNTRFQMTGETLETVSEEFIKFSKINNTDLNNSIDNVDSIMKKFNVDASQTPNVLGLMTKAGQDTGISMETLQGTLGSNGAVLKELGLDITGSVNLLAQMEASGVDAGTAMAGLKKAQQNATAEGKSFKEALSETVGSIKSAGSETQALQTATELFGKKGAAEMTQAIREGRFSIEDLSSSLSDYSNIVSDTFESTLSPWDKSKTSLNQLKVAGSELAQTAISSLEPAFTAVTQKVEGFTNWFEKLDTQEKEQIVTIGAVIAAIGPGLVIIGKVSQGISAISNVMGFAKTAIAAHTAASAAHAAAMTGETAATTGATVAQTGLNTAMLACPVTWIVAAIVAIVAIIAVLWNKCEGFRNVCITVWDGIKGVFSGFGDILTTAKEKFDGLKENAGKAFQGIKEYAASELAETKKTFEEHGGGIKGAAAVAMRLSTEHFRVGYDAINALTKGKLGEAVTKAKEKFNGIKETAASNLGALKTITGNEINSVIDTFKSKGGGLKGAAAATIKLTQDAWKAGFIGLNTLTKGKLGEVVESGKEKLAALHDKFKEGINKIKSTFSFKLTLPQIKMPQITVTYDSSGTLGKAAKFLGLAGLPKFGIKWNAQGAILTRPTIFGFASGQFQGGGEAGKEAVLPIDTLQDYIDQSMSKFVASVPQIDYDKLAQVVINGVKAQDMKIVINQREVGRIHREAETW